RNSWPTASTLVRFATRAPSRRGQADGTLAWIPSVAITPASPTSRIRTETPGLCKNAVIGRGPRNDEANGAGMGLSWQQGPLSSARAGRFLIAEPLPRLLFVEPLRRRLRVKLAGRWIAESEDVLLLHEPGRYPVAYFPLSDVEPEVLASVEWATSHPDLGHT